MSRPPIPGKKHGEFSVFTVFFGGCLLPRTLLGWDWKSQSLASSCEPGQRSWPTRTARCELRFLNIYIPTISEDGLSSKEQTSRSEFWKMTFLNHLRMTFWIHLDFFGCFFACVNRLSTKVGHGKNPWGTQQNTQAWDLSFPGDLDPHLV